MKRTIVLAAVDSESKKSARITIELDAPAGEMTRKETERRVDSYTDDIHEFLRKRGFHTREIKAVKP